MKFASQLLYLLYNECKYVILVVCICFLAALILQFNVIYMKYVLSMKVTNNISNIDLFVYFISNVIVISIFFYV